MISINQISKSFPGVKALDNVSFDIKKGEVHGLVGENGAGKSTLVKILSGIYTEYDGEILVDNQTVRFGGVLDAQKSGIATVFQELSVVRDLTVAENIFLGREPVNKLGIIDRNEMKKRCSEIMSFLDEPLDVDKNVGDLSIASQQIVELCKALVLNARVIIMDEPTSSLTEKETTQLYKIVARLKSQGVTIIYVSHKLEEILSMCDTVTVLRDGKHIATVSSQNLDIDGLIQMMVGRTLTMLFPERTIKLSDEVLLSVRGATRKGQFEDVTFDLHKGEILGFSGLIGSGRTEFAKALYGATVLDSGTVTLNKKNIEILKHPSQALMQGISYLSEDRQGEGLLMQANIRENTTLSVLKKLHLQRWGSEKKEREMVQQQMQDLQVKMIDINQIVENLSGGNQQKVILGRLLLTNAMVFLFDEPTRGIDVGAKYEIYKIMDELTKQGKGIIFISSELPEVLGVSDRIACMRAGRLERILDASEATPEAIMKILTGGGEC